MEKPSFDQLPQAVLQLHEKLSSIEQILLNQNTKSETDEILTIQEAAKLINLSVPTIYGLVQRSSIPVSKQGKRLYFSKSELLSWIKEGRKKTNAEISREAENYIKNKSVGGGRRQW